MFTYTINKLPKAVKGKIRAQLNAGSVGNLIGRNLSGLEI
jgi:hypothetical protein